MNYSIQIAGTVDETDAAKQTQIQALTQVLVNALAALGVTVESSSASTPNGATTPIPSAPQAPAQPA